MTATRLCAPAFLAAMPPLQISSHTSQLHAKRKPRSSASSSSSSPSSSSSSSSSWSSTNPSLSAPAFSYPEKRPPTRHKTPLSAKIHTPASIMHYVFVYGTLKKGFPNAYMLDRATFVGGFRTLTRFPLVVGGKYNSPYLLDLPSKGSRVKGELYAVDDAVLADLDDLENVGVNYTRTVTKVCSCADRAFAIDAFVYLKTNNLHELAQKEYLDDYQCRLYVPRHMRQAHARPAPCRKSLVSASK